MVSAAAGRRLLLRKHSRLPEAALPVPFPTDASAQGTLSYSSAQYIVVLRATNCLWCPVGEPEESSRKNPQGER